MCRALKEMVRVVDTVSVFLIETNVADVVVAKVMHKVGFTFFEVVSPFGRKGGLAFCWKPELQLDFVWKSCNIFYLLIKPGNEYQHFFLFSGLWTNALEPERSFLGSVQSAWMSVLVLVGMSL